MEQDHADQLARIVGVDRRDVAFIRTRYAAERDRRLRPDANGPHLGATAEFSY